MSADVVFSLEISVKTKVFVVRDEVPHFLRGPRLQPVQPIGKSSPAAKHVCRALALKVGGRASKEFSKKILTSCGRNTIADAPRWGPGYL